MGGGEATRWDGFSGSAAERDSQVELPWKQMLGRGWEATGRRPALLSSPPTACPSATPLPPPHHSALTHHHRGQTGCDRADLVVPVTRWH